MQITAEINTDDIVAEIMDSSDLDRHINEAVDSLVNDQIEEHLGRIDINDIDGSEDLAERVAREVMEDQIDSLVRDAVLEAMTDASDPQDTDDRIADLERRVEALADALNSVVSILSLTAKVVVPAP